MKQERDASDLKQFVCSVPTSTLSQISKGNPLIFARFLHDSISLVFLWDAAKDFENNLFCSWKPDAQWREGGPRSLSTPGNAASCCTVPLRLTSRANTPFTGQIYI